MESIVRPARSRRRQLENRAIDVAPFIGRAIKVAGVIEDDAIVGILTRSVHEVIENGLCPRGGQLVSHACAVRASVDGGAVEVAGMVKNLVIVANEGKPDLEFLRSCTYRDVDSSQRTMEFPEAAGADRRTTLHPAITRILLPFHAAAAAT